MEKTPILYCKCKMCGSTYTDRYPLNRDKEDGKYIAKYAGVITSTHDCSQGENSIPNAFGVGEILGVVYR